MSEKTLKTTIRPVGHHLVVEPITLPEKSKGGIIIKHDGTNWDKLQKASRMLGTILAVGPQCWKAHAASLQGVPGAYQKGLMTDWAKEGDMVFYSRHAGKFMFDPVIRKEQPGENGSDLKEIYVINDDDVIAVLPPMSEWNVDVLDIMSF